MRLSENIFGTISWAALVLLTLTSLPLIRRTSFQTFYYTHFLFLLFILFGALHRVAFAWFAAMGCALYTFDRILRFARSRTNVELLDVKALHSDAGGCTKLVVKLGSGKPREWEAGQYAFISFPKLGNFLDYYPMSVSSAPDLVGASSHAHLLPWNPTATYLYPNGQSPEGTVVSFHVKASGGFTQELYAAASSLDSFASSPSSLGSPEDLLADSAASSLRNLTSLHVDGFHGHPRVNFTSFRTVVLIGGGIGITPMLSMARDLGNRMGLALSPSPETATLAFETRTVYLLWYTRSTDEYGWLRDECRSLWSLGYGLRDRGLRLVLRVFLTRSGPPLDMDAVEQSNIYLARPTPREILEDVKRRHPGDAAVGVCGPAKLVRDVRNACADVSDAGGMMKIHWEHFEL
jgi:hypothetical protein